MSQPSIPMEHRGKSPKENSCVRQLKNLTQLLLYGGEGGIRTHGTLPYHWFSRPAPLPHNFFAI